MEEKKIDEINEEFDSFKDEKKDEKEKTFTQQELEKIIEQRLMRERKNSSDLLPLKQMLFKLKEDGVIRSSSYNDMTKEVLELLSERTDALAPNKSGKDEENSEKKEHNEEKKENKEEPLQQENKDDAEKKAKEKDSYFEVAEFINNFSQEEFRRILSDKVFLSFCMGRKGTLSENYLAYYDLLRKLAQNEEARKSKSAQNALRSTGFSGDNSGFANDYSSLLTKRQMEIARDSGMSYREYAELLGQIPTADSIKRKRA